MATIIKIKNSGSSGAPTAVATGELAHSYQVGSQANGGDRLYIGTGAETGGVAANIEVIGGKYFTDMLNHVHGTLTADSAIITDSNSKIDVLNVDNLRLDANSLTSTDTNGDITVNPNGTGNINLTGPTVHTAGDFSATTATGGTITLNASASGAINMTGALSVNGALAQTGTGYFKIEGTGGFVIPTGTLSNRHPTPETGMMRFNTQDDRVEIYDQSGQWVSVAGSSGAVSAQDAEEIAIKMAVVIG